MGIYPTENEDPPIKDRDIPIINSTTSASTLANETEVGIFKMVNPLVGYKKVRCVCKTGLFSKMEIQAVAELEIPKGATVVGPFGNWCRGSPPIHALAFRTDNVLVKRIYGLETTIQGSSVPTSCSCYSMYMKEFKYIAGKTHRPEKPLDLNRYKEHASGIYFHLTKREAKKHGK